MAYRVRSLLIDGATKAERHFEGVLIWTIERIYFYSLEEMESFTTHNLQERLLTLIRKLTENNINVAVICSDNASNNRALFNRANNDNLIDKLDIGLIRIPCCAHVINLSIQYVLNSSHKWLYSLVEKLLKKPPKGTRPQKFTTQRNM